MQPPGHAKRLQVWESLLREFELEGGDPRFVDRHMLCCVLIAIVIRPSPMGGLFAGAFMQYLSAKHHKNLLHHSTIIAPPKYHLSGTAG